MGFQTVINVEYGAGLPGGLATDAPFRAQPAELVSASAAYNVVGATAYTITTADPGDNSASIVAAAGGTGPFAGVLMNSKVYATSGPSTGALNPTMTLPNYFIGELLLGGDIWVTLANSAAVGDSICYDQTTGALSAFKPSLNFTAAMATNGVLTVTAVTAGNIQVGSVINGTGAQGVVVVSLGTGTGNTGTYNTDYNYGAAITSQAWTGTSGPPVAANFTATVATTGVVTVSAVASGIIEVGQVLYGTGIPAGTFITALGTGVGGTGTYSTNITLASALSTTTVTADATVAIPSVTVQRFSAVGGNSLAMIHV